MSTTIYITYHDPEGYAVAKVTDAGAASASVPLSTQTRAAILRNRLALEHNRQAVYGTWPLEFERYGNEYRAQLGADKPLSRECWIVRD